MIQCANIIGTLFLCFFERRTLKKSFRQQGGKKWGILSKTSWYGKEPFS